MYKFESIDLGNHRGDDYFLVGFVEPGPTDNDDYDPDEDADNYGVTVARTTSHPSRSNIEVVRMDTAHGYPHLDKAYLPDDADEQRKKRLDDGYEYSRMKQYLLANWKQFADLYIKWNE